MSKILSFVLGLFTSNGHGANAVGNAVVNVTTIAALTPAALWLLGNKDVIAVQFTYGQLGMACAFIAAVIKLAHVLRRGSPEDRAP
jgi:hypothetical protein